MNDSVLIIDFGSQVTQLIARRLREMGSIPKYCPCTTAPEKDRGGETARHYPVGRSGVSGDGRHRGRHRDF